MLLAMQWSQMSSHLPSYLSSSKMWYSMWRNSLRQMCGSLRTTCMRHSLPCWWMWSSRMPQVWSCLSTSSLPYYLHCPRTQMLTNLWRCELLPKMCETCQLCQTKMWTSMCQECLPTTWRSSSPLLCLQCPNDPACHQRCKFDGSCWSWETFFLGSFAWLHSPSSRRKRRMLSLRKCELNLTNKFGQQLEFNSTNPTKQRRSRM